MVDRSESHQGNQKDHKEGPGAEDNGGSRGARGSSDGVVPTSQHALPGERTTSKSGVADPRTRSVGSGGGESGVVDNLDRAGSGREASCREEKEERKKKRMKEKSKSEQAEGQVKSRGEREADARRWCW